MNTILILTTLLISVAAFAHGDHPKPIAKCVAKCTKEEIQAAIPAAIGKLILKGSVTKEWSKAKVEKVELKTFSKGPEWVAIVHDSANKTQPSLYVFITTQGYLNGSNFTGN